MPRAKRKPRGSAKSVETYQKEVTFEELRDIVVVKIKKEYGSVRAFATQHEEKFGRNSHSIQYILSSKEPKSLKLFQEIGDMLGLAPVIEKKISYTYKINS